MCVYKCAFVCDGMIVLSVSVFRMLLLRKLTLLKRYFYIVNGLLTAKKRNKNMEKKWKNSLLNTKTSKLKLLQSCTCVLLV